MSYSIRRNLQRIVLCAVCSVLVVVVGGAGAAAQEPQNPQSGSVGLEGTVPSEPPSEAPGIVIPGNGQSFADTPIRVSGLCPDELLVEVFSNEVFVGSAMCEAGSYELEVGIFGARNTLVARAYDALDQAGPDSNAVTVTLNDAQFAALNTSPMTLTSDFARRGADPGEPLSWPFILSGGRGPYAVSVDPGDGSEPILQTLDAPGVFSIEHTYEAAGVYRMAVRVTDDEGQTAFLRVVGVANGNPVRADEVGASRARIEVVWWPAAFSVLFIFAAFWLGRRYQVQALRKKLEQYKG